MKRGMKEEARVSKYIRETRPAAIGVGARVDIKVLEDEGKGRIFLHRRNYNNGPDTVIPAGRRGIIRREIIRRTFSGIDTRSRTVHRSGGEKRILSLARYFLISSSD